jgi:hypothetical protein
MVDVNIMSVGLSALTVVKQYQNTHLKTKPIAIAWVADKS